MKLKLLIPIIIFLIGCGGEPPQLENVTLQFEKAVYLGKLNSLLRGDSYRFKLLTRDNAGYLSVKEIWATSTQVKIDGDKTFIEINGTESTSGEFIKANTIIIHLHDKSDIDFGGELR